MDATALRMEFAMTMASIYREGSAPPEWTLDVYATQYDTYAPKARLIIDAGVDRELVARIASEREPVNFAMTRHYDAQRLFTFVDYQISGYQSHFNKTGQLAPNIGVYTYAPVLVRGQQHDAHIYHAVGAALDSPQQADYKVLVEESNDSAAALTAFYVRVFEKIFYTAHLLGLHRVIMSLVGASNFAAAYGSEKLQRESWVPAFKRVRERFLHLRVDLMGGEPGPAMDYFANAHKTSLFPAVVVDAKDALIVNAWDPHSMPGNGNAADASLDGHVGRSSAVHFFGWPVANLHLLQNVITVQAQDRISP